MGSTLFQICVMTFALKFFFQKSITYLSIYANIYII